MPDPTSGKLSWLSVHFKVSLGDIVSAIQSVGYILNMNCNKHMLDMEARSLRQKREANDKISHIDQPTDNELLQSVKIS